MWQSQTHAFGCISSPTGGSSVYMYASVEMSLSGWDSEVRFASSFTNQNCVPPAVPYFLFIAAQSEHSQPLYQSICENLYWWISGAAFIPSNIRCATISSTSGLVKQSCVFFRRRTPPISEKYSG